MCGTYTKQGMIGTHYDSNTLLHWGALKLATQC